MVAGVGPFSPLASLSDRSKDPELDISPVLDRYWYEHLRLGRSRSSHRRAARFAMDKICGSIGAGRSKGIIGDPTPITGLSVLRLAQPSHTERSSLHASDRTLFTAGI